MPGMKQVQDDTIALLRRALAQDFRLMPLPTPESPVFLAVAWPVAEGVTGLKPRLPAGRGLTLHQAMISAGAEALELRSSLMQHHTADLAPKTGADEVALIAATDLLTGETVAVPAQEVYLDAASTLGEPQRCDANSTGCATGQTRAEATASALHECIERDALALWWHGRHAAGTLAVELIDTLQPRLFWWLHRRTRSTQLLDLTTDIGLPVVASVSAEPDGQLVALGAAARPSLADAALAAVTEMVQAEVSMVEARAAEDPEIAAWDAWASIITRPQFRPAVRPATTLSPMVFEALLRRLADLGHRALAVDLTLSGDPLPSMRVLVPGLCAMQARIDTPRFRRLCPDRTGPSLPEPF